MINKLIANIKKTNAPIVVGLDPMLNYVPEHVQKKAFAEYGETLEGAAEAVWQFNKAIVDATYDLIPAVKPQVAMYEQFGVPGMAAYEKTVSYCQEKGLVVIGDIKRGDIGSTSEAYAVGHLGHVQVGSKSYAGFHEDFATVNPYLGSDGVKPFIKVCKEELRQPPYDYFLMRKIDISKTMLAGKGVLISEVAAKLNFTDQYHFSRIFKEKTGRSPSEFRMEAQRRQETE